VVATRNSEGGSMGEFAAERVSLSKVGPRIEFPGFEGSGFGPDEWILSGPQPILSRSCPSPKLRGLQDLARSVGFRPRARALGEVGYRFNNRVHGESKLDILVGLEYVELLLHKLTRGTIPVSYLLFGLTGSVGVIVNFLLAALFGYWLRLDFRTSQLAGALITIAVNFLLNNQLTSGPRD